MAKFSTKFSVLFITTMVLILVVSACSQRAEDSIAPPQAIVDTSQVADMVLEEVGIQLTAESAARAEAQVEEPNAGDTSLDVDTIVETVVARLEEREEAQEEALPVTFGNDALQHYALDRPEEWDIVKKSLSLMRQNGRHPFLQFQHGSLLLLLRVLGKLTSYTTLEHQGYNQI